MHLLQVSISIIVLLILDCVFRAMHLPTASPQSPSQDLKRKTLQNYIIEPTIGLGDDSSLSEKYF